MTLTAPDGASLPTRGLVTWLANAAPAKARGEVTVALVSDARMRTLNRSYRNKDYATDVLSFPAFAEASTSAKAFTSAKATVDRTAGRAGKAGEAGGSGYLGDIVIATGVAHSVRDLCEIAFSRVGLDYEKYVTVDE